MLLSMTGFGEARAESPGPGPTAVAVEVRAVNNRHLKLTVRGSDPYPQQEAEVEKVVRRHIRRGTVTVHVRVERAGEVAGRQLDGAVLAGYLRQIRDACETAELPEAYAAQAFAGVLALPGVVPESARGREAADDEWPVFERALLAALAGLDRMRAADGRATADELMRQHAAIGDHLGRVRELLPAVTTNYRQRLLERVRQAVAGAGVEVHPDHLVREVAQFADRSDVAEEVSRLAAHLDQFAEVVAAGGDGAGKRLEFVAQEMGREANTLGSKAGDVTVGRHAVEIKAALERVRELAANVE